MGELRTAVSAGGVGAWSSRGVTDHAGGDTTTGRMTNLLRRPSSRRSVWHTWAGPAGHRPVCPSTRRPGWRPSRGTGVSEPAVAAHPVALPRAASKTRSPLSWPGAGPASAGSSSTPPACPRWSSGWPTKVRRQRTRRNGAGITLEMWDAEHLSRWLKRHPQTVHDFFGRAWVEELFGSEQSAAFCTRLDAQQVAELREQLGGFYATFFARTDSGRPPCNRHRADWIYGSGYVSSRCASALRLRRRARRRRHRLHVGAAGHVLHLLVPQGPGGRLRIPLCGAGLGTYTACRFRRCSPAGHRPGAGGSAWAGEATGIRTAPDVWLASASRHLLVGIPDRARAVCCVLPCWTCSPTPRPASLGRTVRQPAAVVVPSPVFHPPSDPP